MNKISAKKLLNSKWTAVTPVQKEKHFVVTEVECNEDGTVSSCSLEAIISKRTVSPDWQNLKDAKQWKQGWN